MKISNAPLHFCVVNLGCKVNRVESDAFIRQFTCAGACAVAEEDADLIIVNTCTVTSEAEKKARKAVRHALRTSSNADVVVTGCASAICADEFSSMDARVLVVPKSDMTSFLDEYIRAHVSADSQCTEPDFPGAAETESTYHMRPRTRCGVKIQDGCDNACTYCIVHVARGASLSRDPQEILAECKDLASHGVREIVLTGVNIGSFQSSGMNLSTLLSALLDETQSLCADEEYPMRFRLTSIEPQDVDDALIDIIAQANGRICRHLHLPLQSGSSKVLREMARPYDAQTYCDLAAHVRKSVPALALTTDVIVGFPGETDDDFAHTCAVARACGFSKMHVFPYSPRKNTSAASRPDQVDARVRAERAAQMRELARDLRAADLAARKGNRELAIVLDDGRALTESYYEIVPPADAQRGEFISCVL